MGTFSTAIEIGRPDGSAFETVNALVDTGARLTTVPADILRRLGVTPHRKFVFAPADGREVERDVGHTWIRVAGQSAITFVVFGDAEIEPLLGAYSLQGLMLGVDSPNEQLIPIPRLLM